VEVKFSTWEYGDVAEILHVGPYSAEQPTIEKLLTFISKQGYKIAGPHEKNICAVPACSPPAIREVLHDHPVPGEEKRKTLTML